MNINNDPLKLLFENITDLPKILNWFSENAEKIPEHLMIRHLSVLTKFAADMKQLYIASLLSIPGESREEGDDK